MKRVEQFFNTFSGFIRWLTPFALFVGVLYFSHTLFETSFDDFERLLSILIWPVTLLGALYFFRKVFTYMFFSMDRYNFFGIQGTLKPVEKVIEENIQEKVNKEKEIKEQIEKVGGDKDKVISYYYSQYVEVLKREEESKTSIRQLQAQIVALLQQIQNLQAHQTKQSGDGIDEKKS